MLWQKGAEPLGLGKVHRVDTTKPVDIQRLIRSLRQNVAMETLSVRPMTQTEFDTFLVNTIRDYAAENVRAKYWEAAEAEERAASETNALLPQGVDTPGMLVLTAENMDGVAVGHLWLALERKPGSDFGAWIYDIQIKSEHQGKGYGRALLGMAEEQSAKHGVKSIGLNVFGNNQVARNLYESAGYQITSMHMEKVL